MGGKGHSSTNTKGPLGALFAILIKNPHLIKKVLSLSLCARKCMGELSEKEFILLPKKAGYMKARDELLLWHFIRTTSVCCFGFSFDSFF